MILVLGVKDVMLKLAPLAFTLGYDVLMTQKRDIADDSCDWFCEVCCLVLSASKCNQIEFIGW